MNPLTVAQRKEPIQIINKLIEEPVSHETFFESLTDEEKKTFNHLVQLKILQVDSIKRAALNFPLFTANDHQILDGLCQTAAPLNL